MKLILILLITFQVSALALAQQVTLNFKNAPITKVLRSIQQQTGYSYSMDGAEVKYAKPVTLTLNNTTIEETLQSLFSNQPFNYKIVGKVIKITHKEVEKTSAAPVKTEKDGEVTGQVTDKDGKPLAGATVSVKDGSLGAVTDANGRFKITGAPVNGTLVITMIGRETRQINYKSNLIGPIILLEVNAALKEVQIIAYGEVEKKFTTSNIGTINSEVISRQPVTNPLMTLQGRTPGLFIQQLSGNSTGTISVIVQGRNSINNGNDPFYVIDGVPYTPNAIGYIGTSINAGAPSNLNFINPADIESISILKDADATAIYGSRAANGAILITTKKGKAGKTTVGLNLQTGWSKLARKPDMMNTAEYLAMRREANTNGNTTPQAWDWDLNGVWDSHRDVDWFKELVSGTAQYQNLQASVSGGNENTQFLVGSGFIRETTVYDGNFSNKKASVNFNINHASTNKKFKFFLSGNYLTGLSKLPQSDLTSDAAVLLPLAPKLYNDDGTINWGPNPNNPTENTFSNNPVAKLLQRYQDKTNNLIASSNISYQLIDGLNIKSSFGFNRLESYELATTPITSIDPRYFLRNRTGQYVDKNTQSWIIEPQLTFNKILSFGNIDALVGTTFQNTDNYLLGLAGTGYTSDAQIPNYNAAGTKTVTASIQSQYKYSAIFARLNYRYNDRYIINLSARRDGSSRFGSENLFHNFYAIGGAWLFSEERFFKQNLPAINYGKIRATYGTSGNDQIGDYSFYSLYDNNSVAIPYQGTIGLFPSRLSNPYLQWEETKKLNLGIDLGAFQNRILFKVDYFRNRSSNQLMGQELSWVTGFSNISRNLPATVQNTGWEFTLDGTPFKSGDFTWSASANLTIPKNKLIRYDGLEQTADRNNYIVGESISIKKVYQFEGVNAETGVYQFRDSKGGLTSSPADPADRFSFVNTDPKLYGGLSNTFSFKGLELDVFLQFVKQRAFSSRFGNYPGLSFSPEGNQPASLVHRWHKPGDQAEYQKVSTDFMSVFFSQTAATSSDAAYSKADYLRLKNVSLSYTIRPALLKRAHISTARLYVQGQNLLTFTNYPGGVDPEIRSASSLGALRTIAVGTQLSF